MRKKNKKEEFKNWKPKKKTVRRKPDTEGSLASRVSFVALQLALSSTSEDLSEDTQKM